VTIAIGDKVRVAQTPLTVTLGLAGPIGQVYGQTMPSVTNVAVIGDITADYAINVRF
jgi:hypothetical protein